uniref:Laminin subunit alpha 3 n=1 Tax=Sphaeramia orbicularis TaxID=375764 RepID=A0A673CRX7_9TELE
MQKMARGMRGTPVVALFWTVLITLVWDADGQETFNDLTGFSLNPPYFNLAEGARISATATCGQTETEGPRYDLYCKLVGGPTAGRLTQNIQGQFCDYCNSDDPTRAHPVTNAIDGTERWWQSPPLSRGLVYNEVNVTLDLGQLFHVAYILIKFANSPRPDLWVLERSVDNGRTYTPWQYFAHSKRECIEQFGKQPNVRIQRDDDQLCTTEYSRIVPLENGEIVVSLVNGRPGAKNFTYSPVLRDFTKATNIRLRFLRTSTLLGHLISKAQRDPTVTRRYYYSIKDISIGGRCVCHGHAQVCGGTRDHDSPNRSCECQHNTCGESCDRCCPGFNQKPWRAATVNSPNECQPCQCFSHAFDCYYDPEVEKRGASLDTFGRYDGGGVCIGCQHNTAGVNCERCIEGFYRPFGVPPESPIGCIPCRCDGRTTAGCEMGSGRCICKPQFAGENCDRCADGYIYYPQCIRYPVYPTTTKSPAGPIVGKQCRCDYRGTVPRVCDASGRCLCRPFVEGEQCDRCQPGYHSFPNCQACQCSQAGSYSTECNPLSGQCSCLPGVVGQKCDRCASGLRFPHCSVSVNKYKLTFMELTLNSPYLLFQGSCRCLPNVEGTLCDKCKPLFWNLATTNPQGCTECRCDVKGTLSGIGECEQKSGQCHCKSNACGHTCDTCKDGYFMLQKRNYFGCQGCQCDVGGAVGMTCEDMTGQCQCRKNVVGRKCTEPAPNYFFPSLHQLKFEVEDGTTPNARPVRFSFNSQEFPGFSWRGYAVMSPAQNEVRVTVHVDPKDERQQLFRVVLRFTNPSSAVVTGIIWTCSLAGSEQSKEVVFPMSPSPSFLTVPGEGFAEPFALTPGKWIIHIKAQGVLLDYLVLLPRDYYEAPLLQEKITVPCTYLLSTNRDTNCLLYKHVAMDAFSSSLASQGRLSNRSGRRRRQSRVRRLTPDHPEMAALHGKQSQLQLSLRVPRPGAYALVLEYASEEDNVQNVNILISSQPGSQIQARANIYSCAYSFLCRSVAVDSSNRVAALQLTHRTELLLQTSTASFLLVIEMLTMILSLPIHSVYILLSLSLSGSINASFCPAVSGCRDVVIADGRIALDFAENSWRQPTISVIVPPHKTLFLVSLCFTQLTLFLFSLSPRTSSQFCRDSARSLVAAYNDGALPCNCDQSGSTGPTCDPVGGQCPCRQFVIGRQCTKCATGYYGFPYCRPCECGRRLCDEVTGRCICPPQTVRPSCDTCQSQTFSYDPLLGCEGCQCSPNGTEPNAGPDCDRDTGQCSCKPRIGGRQCDRCRPGYYSFPQCLPCDCNQGGASAEICQPDTGRCLCKRNVAGVRCDTCWEGSFHFNPSNPVGCTSCFCFGATNQCQSSSKRRGKFVEMRGWRLESPDQDDVASVLNAVSNTVVADVQELSPTVRVLHWVAPQSYLGNRVSSYGGFLTYQSKSFGIPSEGMTLMDRRPDVILTGHNMTLIHIASQLPNPDRVYQGRVQFTEGNWRHAGTNRPVSREELMMVLASLVGLRVRALYFTQSQRLSLGEVGLEEATNTGTGGPGNTVEDCSCPPEYTGDSCEKCAPGYFRDGSGSYLGRCLPCNCNGHANECEDKTGRCLNCQYNTAGDRCERCKEGYYGNAALRTCTLCPCPFSVPSNSFAVGCRDVNEGVQCICKLGYTGDRCERCSPGFYGDPLIPGGSCRPCNCNGNGNNCDSRTGVCKNTLEPGDTNTDEQCQECDNCAQTLLHDLEKLDDELKRIKAQLDNATASASSQERLKKLEKILVNKYNSSVNSQKSRVKQLEEDMSSLTDDISLLKQKPKYLFVIILTGLLDLLNEDSTSGDKPPNENLSKMIEEAQRMVNEMEKRNFTRQRTAAEKEKDEANISKQCDQNEAAAKKIRSLLKDYEAKLKDLDAALKEAADLVKKATAQNGLSAQTLKDLNSDPFSYPLQEYEQLAAQLDGAKTDLTKKVNEISKAAANEKLVEAAEEHAKNLTKMAEDLENAVKNASGLSEVRNAKDAIEAYKNITDVINAAEDAANKAKVAATDALNVSKLTQRAKDLKNTGGDLLDSARASDKDLKGIKLLGCQSSCFVFVFPNSHSSHSDDIGEMINDAKMKAASANDTASSTMDKLNAIRKEIDKINVTPGDSNLSRVMDDVDESVKKLLKTIPSLNDKISEVENLTSQFSPLNNITENIKKIKDLIEQARDAANRVSIGIPMKFTGEGYVELRPPKDLEDLKAYTALSLLLQRPEGRGDGRRRRRQTRGKEDMFVMYLGNRNNYIGMALRKNTLYGVYKLNGYEHEIKTGYITTSTSEQAKFDKVDLRRIYQDAELILTKDYYSTPSGAPIRSGALGEDSQNLLDPNDIVFYVGGYPANFTPPDSLNYPMYTGCIEFASFNDRVVSLYNFQNADKINVETPCKRHVRQEDSNYFEGTGYGKVNILRMPSTFLVDMTIYSRAENDDPLHEKKYFELHFASLFFPQMTTDWEDIIVVITSHGKINVRVASETVSAIAEYNHNDFKECYVGGIPQNIRELHNITLPPFKGCLKNLKLNKIFKLVDDQLGSKPDFIINRQYNDGQWHYLTVTRRDEGREQRGSATIPDTSGALFLGKDTFKGCVSNLYTRRPHFSVDVRTRSQEGLLFFTATRGGRSHLALYMSKGRIRLSVGKEREIFNREKYSDGKWHSVIFSLEKKKFRLVVDGIRALDGQLTNAELTSMQQFMSPVYLGSVPESLHKQLKHSVSGCVRNFKMNGAPMTDPSTNHGAGPCFEGQTQKGAYFSGNGAYVIINESFAFDSSFELLFNIRPRNLTGLLLHVGDLIKTLHLDVSCLQVVAEVNNGKGEFMVSVQPKTTLCDGTFHKISVIKRKNVVQLHVDTVDNYKIGPPLSTPSLTKYPLYVGGIPGKEEFTTVLIVI